ncbi:MAG: D-glycero-beta-D-manno-heptose 1,7-bisphosphate 7-phosphatase [Ignavibacteriales bacterium]|nr:D-glycero-beta-D-manno-heptose 1,7-bisphosphate 7-phosphatase [Ignavibacteriales bacterium]
MEKAHAQRHATGLLVGALRQEIHQPVQRPPEINIVKFEDVGIFFDRDGTINAEVDFLSDPDELELLPGVAEAIREANELGLKVFVITNQSGIARGFLSEHDLEKVHKKLRALLSVRGARIDKIYYCPHHPEFGKQPYNVACDCRKPNTGMLKAAARTFGVDLLKSFVVGDRFVDMKAGENAGCTTVLVLTGYGEAEREECLLNARVDYVAKNAGEAWRFIRNTVNQGKNFVGDIPKGMKGIES